MPVGVTGMIRTALLPETNSIRCAFIFGSYAAGSTTPESDIDLMIIGDITLRKIVSTLKPAQISREINPIVLSEREFRLKIGSHDHFFTSLIDSPKVYLIGDDNDFRRLIEARQA